MILHPNQPQIIYTEFFPLRFKITQKSNKLMILRLLAEGGEHFLLSKSSDKEKSSSSSQLPAIECCNNIIPKVIIEVQVIRIEFLDCN